MQFFNRIKDYSSGGQSYNSTLYCDREYVMMQFDVMFYDLNNKPVSWESGYADLLHLASSKAYFVLYQPEEISTAKLQEREDSSITAASFCGYQTDVA
jgi:hypothetical protein